jgi:hypothetical protein
MEESESEVLKIEESESDSEILCTDSTSLVCSMENVLLALCTFFLLFRSFILRVKLFLSVGCLFHSNHFHKGNL